MIHWSRCVCQLAAGTGGEWAHLSRNDCAAPRVFRKPAAHVQHHACSAHPQKLAHSTTHTWLHAFSPRCQVKQKRGALCDGKVGQQALGEATEGGRQRGTGGSRRARAPPSMSSQQLPAALAAHTSSKEYIRSRDCASPSFAAHSSCSSSPAHQPYSSVGVDFLGGCVGIFEDTVARRNNILYRLNTLSHALDSSNDCCRCLGASFQATLRFRKAMARIQSKSLRIFHAGP